MNDDQMVPGFFLSLSLNERSRIESAAKFSGGSVESWLLLAVLDAVEHHEKKTQALNPEAP
jgi:hypothetical protein